MSILGPLFGLDDKTAEKQDRSRALSGWDAEWANLTKTTKAGQDLYGMGMPNAAAGAGNVGFGADYFKSILSNPTTAYAPQTNQLTAQQDALRQAMAALGTSRGGGNAGANQTANTNTQAGITNAMFQAQPQAAQGLVQAGGTQAQISAQQIAQALSAIGMSAEQIQHIINSSIGSLPVSHELGQREGLVDFGQFAKNLLGLVA